MSDTLVQEPVVTEPVAPAIAARKFGKGAVTGIIVGAVIVIAVAFGGGFVVGSGMHAGPLGSSNSSQQGPGGGAPNGRGGQNGPRGQNGQQGQNGQNGQQGQQGQNGPQGQQGQNNSNNNQNG
ncbi:MAG: hypothetical protein V4479_07715 [Actinomycetota bacterium]